MSLIIDELEGDLCRVVDSRRKFYDAIAEIHDIAKQSPEISGPLTADDEIILQILLITTAIVEDRA